MPQIIRTIDDYFEEMKKDLYFIQFTEGKKYYGNFDRNNIDLAKVLKCELEIKDWFAKNLPEIKLNPIYPISYDSGYITLPWDHSFSIEFTPDTLKIFCNVWEDEDGKSLSPDFQCYLCPYKGPA